VSPQMMIFPAADLVLVVEDVLDLMLE
jgi:hypothetical protein